MAGLGEAATEFLGAYRAHPRVRVVACADRRPLARERFAVDFPGARCHSDVESLCRDEDVEVVVVATNHEFHTEPALWAADAGKHVIVEKPMALTLEDCDRMIEACDKAGVVLLGGHNHSYDAPIRLMRRMVATGQLGPLRAVNSWNFNDFMVRPYPDDHLKFSHGVVLNQGAHHVDIVRLIAGGVVRSVRTVVRCDALRPAAGGYTCFMEFADGAAATLVYSGYGGFDTAEMFGWLGEGGQPRQPGASTSSRRNFLSLDPTDRQDVIASLKERLRYGNVGIGERAMMPPGWEKGGRPPGTGPLPTRQPFFGFTVVSCERGDIRQSPDGLIIYEDDRREQAVAEGEADGRGAEIDEMWSAVREGRPPIHDGRWSKATIEVCLAMITSSEERREVLLSHQVPLAREP